MASVVCQPCSPGTSQPLSGQTHCDSCLPGTSSSYAKHIFERCKIKPAALTADTRIEPPVTVSCCPHVARTHLLCPSRQSLLGATACEPCPVSTYSRVHGAASCSPCEYPQASGVGASECTTCVAGFVQLREVDRELVADGASPHVCDPCPNGMHVGWHDSNHGRSHATTTPRCEESKR